MNLGVFFRPPFPLFCSAALHKKSSIQVGTQQEPPQKKSLKHNFPSSRNENPYFARKTHEY